MEEFCFTWKIENFTLCVNKKDGFLASPTFVAHPLEKTEWFLQMYPYGDGNTTHVACYLNRSNTDESGQSSITINFNFSFVLADGSENLLRTFERQAFPLSQRFGCNDLKRRDDILKERSILLPKDTLTIRCYMHCCKTVPSDSQNKTAIKSLAHYLYDEKPEASTSSLHPEMYSAADDILKGVKGNLCPYSESCTARTKIRLERRSFIWRLENFSNFKKHEKVSIPLTSVSKNSPSLLITFYLDDESVADEHVQIEIRLKKNTTTQGMISKCKITVLNNKGKQCDFNDDLYFFKAQAKDAVWKFPPIIKKSKLVNDKNLYLKNDILSLLCEFAMSDGTNLNQIEDTAYSSTELENKAEPMKNLMAMRDDFSALMTEAKLSDVILLIEKNKIPAHKAVLSARSPVFKAMFDRDMAEKESGIVKVTDMDLDTLTRMMTYMYGGTVEDLQCETAAKLYSASDKYQCLGLKDLCSSFLKENLSVANVCEVLLLADLHQDQELTSSADEFILYCMPETLRSEEWKNFMKIKPQLAGETLHRIGLLYIDN